MPRKKKSKTRIQRGKEINRIVADIRAETEEMAQIVSHLRPFRATLEFKEQLGRTIQEFRFAQGMDIKETSTMLGCSSQQVYRYESGEEQPSIYTLVYLMQQWKINPREFFFRLGVSYQEPSQEIVVARDMVRSILRLPCDIQIAVRQLIRKMGKSIK